jgi:hypothetical protein
MEMNSPQMKNTTTKSEDSGPKKLYTADTRTTLAKNM